MAKRKKPLINGFVRRKKGIFRRFSRATVKTKARINFVQMPERFTPSRPPKPDRRGTVMHDVPLSRKLSIEKIAVNTRMMEIDVHEVWVSNRHHGKDRFLHKDLESRGVPPWYLLRIYFKGDTAFFVKYLLNAEGHMVPHMTFEYEGGLTAAIAVYNRFGSEGLKWKEDG